MTLHNLAIQALNTSAFLYLFACLAYIMALARSGGERREVETGRWKNFGSFAVWVAFALHTFGLAARWYMGGISRPPWTNLYESLIFFAWGVVLWQVYAIRKWKLPVLGVVSMPLVFILMGMSVMTGNKSVEPLIPALQSYWLKIHVVFGMVAYAGFTTAACLAVFHLIRSGSSLSKLGVGMSLMVLLNLGIAGGNEVFDTGHFYMAKSVERQLPSGEVIWAKETKQDYPGGPMVTTMVEVPHAHFFFWASVALFAGAALAFGFRRNKKGIPELSSDCTPEQAHERGADFSGPGFLLFSGGMIAFLGLLGAIGYGVSSHAYITLHSNPYLVMLLVTTLFMAALFVVISKNHLPVLRMLPGADRLDELVYKNVLFGVPFQTLLLITGAIWAYYAWGRAWAWDPKETWALLTWFVFILHLHMKLLTKTRAQILSVVVIIGFAVMVFAFLGVNLVLSGLHSYGSA